MTNIREAIKNFTDKQKVVSLTDTLGGQQEVTFLTEQGLYKVLMKSRKPIAEKFQDWVCEVIEEIMKTGEYRNKCMIENETKSNVLIEQYANKDVLYLALVKEYETYILVKYGITQFTKETLTRHRSTYGKQVYYKYILECQNRDKLERKLQTHTDLISRHVKDYDGKQHNELLRLDNNFNLDKLIKLIESLKESMESKYSVELELAKESTKQKELETKQKEIELLLEVKRMEFQLEMRKLELQQPLSPVKEEHSIIQYFDKCTVFSNSKLDTIKMSELYKKFVEWLKKENINNQVFTSIFKKLNIGIYDNKISNLNGNSGIRNRRFKL